MPPHLTSIWNCLQQVRTLEIQIEERRPPAETVVQWRGHGRVEVHPCGAATLDFVETGVWGSGPGKDLSFRNVYRWSLKTGMLNLAHLRHGPTQPVDLLALRIGAYGVLASEEPFFCGHDVYTGTLTKKDQSLELTWKIRGPSKNIDCCCIYE